jgi:hypothetical protein
LSGKVFGTLLGSVVEDEGFVEGAFFDEVFAPGGIG